MRAAIPHSHYKTVTLVADLRLRGLTAAGTFDGPINAALFEDWLETCLVPTLSPGETVVMDNLPAHKGPRVEQLIKAAGAELRYLPAYSPDMNPIEKAFSKLKAFLRKIAERTVAGLMRALETCAEILRSADRLASASFRLFAEKSKSEQAAILARVTQLSEDLNKTLGNQPPLVVALTLLTAIRVHEQLCNRAKVATAGS